MENDILKHREKVADNILKSFSNDIEKAHTHGEIHPNGKWYWNSQAAGGKGDWRVIKKKEGTRNDEDNSKDLNQPEVTVKQVFSDIQLLNPSTSTISSLGTFVSSLNRQLSADKAKEIMSYLPKESLAYKIVSTANKFSDKQLWTIAYELVKNKEYQKDLAKRIKESEEYAIYQKKRKSEKRAEKSFAKKQAKEAVENAMKQYKDIKIGCKVKHPIFGEGKVLSETEDKIKVFFKNVGEKELLKKFTKLEKI